MLDGEADGALPWGDFLARGDGVATALVEQRAAALTPDDTLDILFTSGTTGKPKGVISSHGQNIRTFENWSATVGLRSDDNYLIINPFFHSFGYKAGWLSAIIRGARMLPVQSFDLEEVLERIPRDKISMIPGPPTIYQSLLTERGECRAIHRGVPVDAASRRGLSLRHLQRAHRDVERALPACRRRGALPVALCQ